MPPRCAMFGYLTWRYMTLTNCVSAGWIRLRDVRYVIESHTVIIQKSLKIRYRASIFGTWILWRFLLACKKDRSHKTGQRTFWLFFFLNPVFIWCFLIRGQNYWTLKMKNWSILQTFEIPKVCLPNGQYYTLTKWLYITKSKGLHPQNSA